MTNQSPEIFFLYDGECPLCQMGASLYKIRQSVGELYTVDARSEQTHPVMQEIKAAGFDVDEGMVVKYQGEFYQGADALSLLARLGDKADFFNKVNNTAFSSPLLVTFCYPLMKMARRIALALKGCDPISYDQAE